MSAVLKWGRVGMRWHAPDIDVTEAVDLERLEGLVEAAVSGLVQGPFKVRMVVQVELDGGQFHDMPFGKGEVQDGEPRTAKLAESGS